MFTAKDVIDKEKTKYKEIAKFLRKQIGVTNIATHSKLCMQQNSPDKSLGAILAEHFEKSIKSAVQNR